MIISFIIGVIVGVGGLMMLMIALEDRKKE